MSILQPFSHKCLHHTILCGVSIISRLLLSIQFFYEKSLKTPLVHPFLLPFATPMIHPREFIIHFTEISSVKISFWMKTTMSRYQVRMVMKNKNVLIPDRFWCTEAHMRHRKAMSPKSANYKKNNNLNIPDAQRDPWNVTQYNKRDILSANSEIMNKIVCKI